MRGWEKKKLDAMVNREVYNKSKNLSTEEKEKKKEGKSSGRISGPGKGEGIPERTFLVVGKVLSNTIRGVSRTHYHGTDNMNKGEENVVKRKV